MYFFKKYYLNQKFQQLYSNLNKNFLMVKYKKIYYRKKEYY